MSQHPINLGLRFALEMAALVAMGYWGRKQAAGPFGYVLAIAVPLLAAALWGIFRVPDDPGAAPVAVPGIVRLLLEAVFFGFAVWGLHSSGAKAPALVLLALTVLHYAISTDRISSVLRK